MSLMKLIAEYDREQEAYISRLEQENTSLRCQLNEQITLTMSGIAARERQTLDLIMCGALTKPKVSP